MEIEVRKAASEDVLVIVELVAGYSERGEVPVVMNLIET